MISNSDAADNEVSMGANAANENVAGEDTPRIVVGIGDSGPSHFRAALVLAAQMGRQRQATLRLVHGSLGLLSITLGDAALQRHVARGQELLEEAEQALSPMVDQRTRINLAALPQTGVEALLQESQTAAMLIVQRRDLSTVRRAFRSDTSLAVAAQAACPVIIVRDDHEIDNASRHGIVVGVGPDSGLQALHVGVAEAVARKCPLTAVFVWDLRFSPTYGGQIDPDEEELAEASGWADSHVARTLTEVVKAHPSVECHARTVKGVIEDGLLQESADAELLIVERHRDAHRASTGLGTLTRDLIDHAPCPVMVTSHGEIHDQLQGARVTERDARSQS
jgi:nucleotide-binding universal stress UspA family protein